MKETEIYDIKDNVVELIGKEWMLITAGSIENFNTMTASWGNMGFLWGKPVVTVYVRPQRYTLEFLEREECFTLSFFSGKYREALNICGTKSGRDTDKVAESGLTPYSPADGTVSFEEARMVIKCRKLYKGKLGEEEFIDKSLLPKWYPQRDLHYMYIAEIEKVWVGR